MDNDISDDLRRWDTFIGWARRFYEWPDFNKEERNYKLAIGQRLHEARDALLAESPAWLTLLAAAISDKDNNLLDWHVKEPFLAWCRAQPEVAASMLAHLWEGHSPLQQLVQRFEDEVPNPPVRNQHGMFASFLLMALDPTTHPMYRNEAYTRAYRLTGYPDRPKHGAGAVYQHALDFLDRLLEEARRLGLPLRDRLDAQSVLWCVTWYKVADQPVLEWPELDRERLLEYREEADPAAGNRSDHQTVWMFQYNPDHYNLEEHIRAKGPADWWEAAQHRSLMHPGQRVYIRRSGGSDRAALVAVGRLVSAVRPSTINDGHFIVDVLFEEWIDPPLTVHEMRQDDVLNEYHPFAVGVFQTNFPLPDRVVSRTERLTAERLKPIAADATVSDLRLNPELDTRTWAVVSVVQRQGQSAFRQRLIEAYGGRCAVTGCDAVDALEAAHIFAYRGPETNHARNGLLLRADIHNLFDIGLLAVDTATMTLVLAPALAETTYAELAGRPLHVPADPRLSPSKEALDSHRQHAGL